MSLEHLQGRIEVKATNDDSGQFEAYLSVFDNVDFGNDKVVKGAFAESLAGSGRMFPLLDQHDSRHVIGGFTAMEDNIGLKISGEFNLDTQQGREGYSNAKKGYLTGFSMGYRVKDYRYEDDIRVLEKVDLMEGSLVTFPMNDKARLVAIKSTDDITERNIERVLRDAGLSRKDAKAIVSGGVKAIKPLRDAEGDEAAITEALSGLKSLVSRL